MNTLMSLGTDYQRQITAQEYEVVVVENASHRNLEPQAVAELPGNFHYFLREETGVSPVAAVNFAFQQCRGNNIGLILDGARLLTPNTLQQALTAFRYNHHALVMVPAYHIGHQEQELHATEDYNEESEQAFLQSLAWQEDGYRLFDHCCPSPGNRQGYLTPFMECCALFAHADHFKRINYADTRFDLKGGGSMNLHMFRSLGMDINIEPVVLVGEGSFHQIHGGVTTSADAQRGALIEAFNRQLNSCWDGQFHALRREPTLLGKIPAAALPWLNDSLHKSQRRFTHLRNHRRDYWEDDQALEATLSGSHQ